MPDKDKIFVLRDTNKITTSTISANTIHAGSFTQMAPSYQELKNQVRDHEVLIAALVNMLGGAVSISESEMSQAFDMTIVAEFYADPRRFVVRIEENQ